MATKKRYRDGDTLHAEVFNELLNTVDQHTEDIIDIRKTITWRPIKINNTTVLNSTANTKPLNLIPGNGINISYDTNGNVTITGNGGGGSGYIAGDNIEINGNIISATDTKYTNGTGITINTNNAINADTNATTTSAIILSNGAPIDAIGIWENNIIPQGTSVQTILEKLLNRELFPSTATKPSFTVSGSNFGVKEIKSTVTITTPTTTKNDGAFNASYDSPTQPSVLGVTWSDETTTVDVISGFTGTGNTKTIGLGDNKITYTFKKNYSAPSNMPVSNLNHPTQSTSKISTDNSDITAIWAASSVTKSVDVTATGVYACFTNISGSTLNNNATTKCALTSGNEIVLNDVPSEVVANKYFKFAFPSDRTVTFKVKDLAGNFVDFSGTYQIETVSNFYNNIDYKILTTTGDKVGVNTYKMVLSKSLNK